MLIWTFLCFTVYHYFTMNDPRDPIQKRLHTSSAALIGLCLLLPIGGWLADAYIGRYRAICYGMWTMWFGAILNGFSLVIGKVVQSYGTYGDPWVTFISKVIMGAGLAIFQANIVQFGIDQLIDASSIEIKSFILWYSASTFGCGVTFYFSAYCMQEYVAVLIVALFLTLSLIFTFLLNHWVTKEQVVSNPLPLITKVVYFTIKSKFKQQITVHLEQQHGFLSKLNIAKSVYNGPFKSEQVEDVKTFFRVMLVIGVFSLFSSGFPTVNYLSNKVIKHLRKWPNASMDHENIKCYENLFFTYSTYTLPMIVVLVYLIVPLSHHFIPKVNITDKFKISLFFFFAGVVALLGIESASHMHQTQLNQTIIKCSFQEDKHSEYIVDIYWSLIPKLLNGASFFLFISSSLEFICAQAPLHMKGLVLGLGLTFYGLSSFIQAGISSPFINSHVWKNAPLSCGIWYFMMQALLVLAGFIVVIVIVKTYKKRTRVNITSQSDWQESDSSIE